jgi:hypothetical protein
VSSWIVIDKKNGLPVLETFDRGVAEKVRRDKFEVLPALEYYGRMNREIKEGSKRYNTQESRT